MASRGPGRTVLRAALVALLCLLSGPLAAQGRDGAGTPADAQDVRWEKITSHFYTLESARIALSPRGTPAIWALEQLGDNILFVSRLGQFGYLDSDNHLRPLDLRAPMGLDALAESEIFKDPIFDLGEVRTYDLLSLQTGPNRFDLYVSHHRFTGRCFEHVVSRRRLEASAEGIRVASPDWEDIYTVRPCIEIKDMGMRFAGHEGGGRLARLDDDRLLLSVGTYQFNGISHPYLAGMDPETDLGKIIEISIPDRSGRIYAMGFRNPQGLLVASDGRVWETEHGPRGGDEVNLVRRGGNYGWPIVTYGLQYGPPRNPWPHNPHQGEHQGYDHPQFAFVPSIGISNIVEPSKEEFPLWATHLLASSLVNQTLYALKLEGDAIVYAEPIRLTKPIRDIISLGDGRIAILNAAAELVLLRNAERHPDAARSFTVSGLTSLAPPHPLEQIRLGQDVFGARVFHYYCRGCHTVTGETLAGPPLDGVIGRAIGSLPGYGYSSALSEARGEWSEDRLRGFFNRTDPALAGTVMPPITMDDSELEDLVIFLRTTSPAAPGASGR